jgi:hypothetical protein
MKTTALLVMAGLVVAAGCEEKKPELKAPAAPKQTGTATPGAPSGNAPKSNIPPAGAPSAPMAGAPAAPGFMNVANLTFPVPEGWKQMPPANEMRLAELHLPVPQGAKEAPVVVFSTAGGSAEQNLNRWGSQFTGGPEPKFETRTVNGLTVHLAEVSGTFTGMSAPAQENWGLKGAIVEAGPMLIFVKMTGPGEQVKAGAAEFDGMIAGVKPQGH